MDKETTKKIREILSIVVILYLAVFFVMSLIDGFQFRQEPVNNAGVIEIIRCVRGFCDELEMESRIEEPNENSTYVSWPIKPVCYDNNGERHIFHPEENIYDMCDIETHWSFGHKINIFFWLSGSYWR